MAAVAEPLAVLSPLPRADGSATYSHAGYTITASANGPIEAQRRDEDPDEATVDVVVRPAAGVGGMSSSYYGAGRGKRGEGKKATRSPSLWPPVTLSHPTSFVEHMIFVSSPLC